MRRRLALGRILLGHPRLVLMDEPYAALDRPAMNLVDELLDEWRAVGATVLVATHADERLTERADGWFRLESGVVAEIGGSGVTDRLRGPVGAVLGGPALPEGSGP